MTIRKVTFSSLLGFTLVCAGAMLAQDIGSRYPAIGDAQRHIHEASEKIDEAEQGIMDSGATAKKPRNSWSKPTASSKRRRNTSTTSIIDRKVNGPPNGRLFWGERTGGFPRLQIFL